MNVLADYLPNSCIGLGQSFRNCDSIRARNDRASVVRNGVTGVASQNILRNSLLHNSMGVCSPVRNRLGLSCNFHRTTIVEMRLAVILCQDVLSKAGLDC